MNNKEEKCNRQTNTKALPIRLSPEECMLIHEAMKKEGWDNISGFVKHKVLGLDYSRVTNRKAATHDTTAIGTLLLNASLDLAGQIEYLNYRYNRDMQQLWREEGTDWKKWASATKKCHNNMLKKTEETLMLIRRICEVLNIKEYFNLPSDEMNIDPDNATKEEMDALAAQLQKERIAMGHIQFE